LAADNPANSLQDQDAAQAIAKQIMDLVVQRIVREIKIMFLEWEQEPVLPGFGK